MIWAARTSLEFAVLPTAMNTSAPPSASASVIAGKYSTNPNIRSKPRIPGMSTIGCRVFA
jgi:hypothetical protein